LTDLGSLNGTFCGGHYLNAGIEVEVKEGMPIAIGMTLFVYREQSLGEVMPFLMPQAQQRNMGRKRYLWDS
jgi:pSer/pThr/pTyr-binding forkhead associated (FHA) protein